MDNKNVFIAIALSMSVLLFWAAFFETPKPVSNNATQKEKKDNENVITPSINEPLKINKFSREDSIILTSRPRGVRRCALIILLKTLEWPATAQGV